MSVKEILVEFVRKSVGEVERAILATPDGVLIAASNPSDVDDVVAALSAAVVAGVSDAFTQYLEKEVKNVVIQLGDGTYAVMSGLGGLVFCALTKPKPNLGLVYHLLGKYSEKLAAQPTLDSEL